MKFYFDSLDPRESNCNELTYNPHTHNDFWVVSKGTIIKKMLGNIGMPIADVNKWDEPGCYWIDLNGDPEWWSGALKTPNPTENVLYSLPKKIIDMARLKHLRIILAADKEGGSMNYKYDCFYLTTQAVITLNLPPGSVVITQGNKNIASDYEKWLIVSGQRKVLEVIYSNHFGNIFFDKQMPMTPLILEAMNNESSVDFNSLNRIYRTQRGAHLFFLAKHKLLDRGLVSGNQINLNDLNAPALLQCDQTEFVEVMAANYPRFLDGDWSETNAANQYNPETYTNSLMTFVTETKFDEPVAFLTEKIFKPIALGHPVILLAAAGTLRALADLGFRIDWCGIDPSYNDIKDDTARFYATHRVLMDWLYLPRDEKLERIRESMSTINHNFHMIRMKDFYKDAINDVIASSGEYFKNVRI